MVTVFAIYLIWYAENNHFPLVDNLESFHIWMKMVAFVHDNVCFYLGDNCIQIWAFGEVNRRFYGRKFRFTATRQRSRKT